MYLTLRLLTLADDNFLFFFFYSLQPSPLRNRFWWETLLALPAIVSSNLVSKIHPLEKKGNLFHNTKVVFCSIYTPTHRCFCVEEGNWWNLHCVTHRNSKLFSATAITTSIVMNISDPRLIKPVSINSNLIFCK